jgi:acyl-CoA thioesterase I
MTNILIFGDSIVWGAWDKEGGWAQRLRKFIDQKNISEPNYDCTLYNLGVCGDTTEDLLERFENETKARISEEERIIIFGVGTNDSQFVYSNEDLKIPIDKFGDNVKKLVDLSKKFSSKIVFLGLCPIEQSKVDPIPWAEEKKGYRKELVEQFNNKIKHVCNEKGVYFIELYEKLIKESKILEDGVHPDSLGHKKIFLIVKNFLIKNKIIE